MSTKDLATQIRPLFQALSGLSMSL
jgi:hypothetical protein